MNLPNGTDSVPIEDLIKGLATDKEIKVDLLSLVALLCDLAYAQGYAEGMEKSLEIQQPKKEKG